MMREVVRYVLAMVVAAGIVFPTADGVRAEGEKADRWQWVEDELIWQQQFLDTIDNRVIVSKNDVERVEIYKVLNKEVLDKASKFRKGLAGLVSRCRTDILVVDVDSALLCESQDAIMTRLIIDTFSSLNTHSLSMLQYYTFREQLIQHHQDFIRGIADDHKTAANAFLRISRDFLEDARKARLVGSKVASLPPD